MDAGRKTSPAKDSDQEQTRDDQLVDGDTVSRDPVEVLAEEFLDRCRRGEDAQIESYTREYPHYADRINDLFPAMMAMERFKLKKNGSSERPIQLHVDRLERLGDYRIVREIGHGGMGIVYEAEQESLHRRVAVKVFPKQAIGDSTQLKRFQREAKTAGALHHTNIVPVFGVGEQDGLHYFVMQLLDGVSLDEVIAGLTNIDPRDRDADRIEYVFNIQRNLQHEYDAGHRRSKAALSGGVSKADGTSKAVVKSSTHQSRIERDRVEQNSDDCLNNDASVSVCESGLSERFDAERFDAERQVFGRHDEEDENAPANSKPIRFGRHHWRHIADIGIQVADALHYAHGRGVMHRDIKPANLVLGADSRVWVTDFGLAVSQQQERLSCSGEVVGTLRYMSPEQLNGRSDKRSDIYSLGLTLFELMTLRPAFEGESRGVLIREVSKSCPPAPRSLCPEIPRDLETIILKAIARSPESRYRTAGALAADLRRFRNDEPIHARRIRPFERVVRWSRRNPALAGMSAAMLLCIIASFAAVSQNWRQAIREKQHAQREGQRAENNLSLALASMDRMLERFESDWMSHPIAADSVTEEDVGGESENHVRFVVSDHSALILGEALEFYDRFAHQNAGNPKLQRDTAKAYRRVGDILDRLGRYEEAAEAYKHSIDSLSAIVRDSHENHSDVIEMATVMNRYAIALHFLYRSEEAKVILHQAKRILAKQLAKSESSPSCTYQLALTNSNLGFVMWRMHDTNESTQHHRRGILLLEGLAEENPLDAEYRLALARAYRNYYPIAANCRERIYSNEIHAAATSLLEQLVSDFPSVPDYRCELSEMLMMSNSERHSDISTRRNDIDQAVELAQQLKDEFPLIPRYEMTLARALTSQAKLYRDSDFESAADTHRRSIDLLRRLRIRFPRIAFYRAMLAYALREYGNTLRAHQRLDESICIQEEAVAERSYYLELRPQSKFGRKGLSSTLKTLAETLEQAGDPDQAAEARAYANQVWKHRPSHESTPDS